MASPWKGHLRNSTLDIIVDTGIAILLIVSLGIQLAHVPSNQTTRGLSPYYLLFNALFNNAQLSEALLSIAFSYPNDTTPVLNLIRKGHLNGLSALGALFGFVQILLCWTFSIANITTHALQSPNNYPGWKGISTIAFLHACVVLLPILPTVLPKPPERNFGNGIITGLTTIQNHIVAPTFVILQFYAQIQELRQQNGDPGALSLFSLALQILAIGAVAARWFLRLGAPSWPPGSGFVPLSAWYGWGFLAVNCVLHVVGCAVLLAMYKLWPTLGGGSWGNERVPLLG